MGFFVTIFFFLKKHEPLVLMLNALHLYSLERLASYSILQYYPLSLLSLQKECFVLICNYLYPFNQFACFGAVWGKLYDYNTHMNTKLQKGLNIMSNFLF